MSLVVSVNHQRTAAAVVVEVVFRQPERCTSCTRIKRKNSRIRSATADWESGGGI